MMIFSFQFLHPLSQQVLQQGFYARELGSKVQERFNQSKRDPADLRTKLLDNSALFFSIFFNKPIYVFLNKTQYISLIK